MDATLAITIVWGIEGLLGMLVLLTLSLFCLLAAIGMATDARGAGWPRKLTAGCGAPLLIATGMVGVVLVVANLPSLFRVQTVKLTVATLDVHYGQSDTYTVKDSSGREFQAQSDVWEQLTEGDRVTCRATAPAFVLEPTLLDCQRTRQHPRSRASTSQPARRARSPREVG